MRKGALVARDPTNYEEIGGTEALNESEVDALRDEVLHKWKQKRSLYLTIIAVGDEVSYLQIFQVEIRAVPILTSPCRYSLVRNADFSI